MSEESHWNDSRCNLIQALLVAMLQSILFQQQALLRSESNRDNSKMKNKSVKKSIVQEKLKYGQAKNLHKKDQQVYNNCYELRLRAIKQTFSLNSPM